MLEHPLTWAADYSRNLLRQGILEAKAGNREAAARYLDRALYMSSDHDVMAEAWYWMSRIVDDPAERRKALQNCLANDLQHARARRDLAILDGRLQPGDVINPDAPMAAARAPEVTEVQRFVCPRCGGRMTFAPDGASLVCEYCLQGHPLGARNGTARDEDFIAAMATAKGHAKPLVEQVFHCEGCGAEYILPPGRLSLICAYCGEAQVIGVKKEGRLLAPEGILPHAFDQAHADELLATWVKALKVNPGRSMQRPRGLYAPVWTFRVGGRVDYTGEVLADGIRGLGGGSRRSARVSDSYTVMQQVSIAASRKPSATLTKLIPTFDLRAIRSYDPGYLASWPAELYDVSMADASLEARSRVYAAVQGDLPSLAGIRLTSASSANLTIESFRLDLLPVWMCEVDSRDGIQMVIINGQSGLISPDLLQGNGKESRNLREWLADLIGE